MQAATPYGAGRISAHFGARRIVGTDLSPMLLRIVKEIVAGLPEVPALRDNSRYTILMDWGKARSYKPDTTKDKRKLQ